MSLRASCLGLLGVLAASGGGAGASAQNGTNYHVLHNGLDAIYSGLGAGGSQTKADGLGTWIAGEDLRGSHIVNFSGDFGARISQWRETACPIRLPASGPLRIEFRGIQFLELDGLNGNHQAVFTSPGCTNPSFPLGGTAGFIPYGTGPGSSVSFGLFGLPAGIGPAPSAAILMPNNGLIPTAGAPGTAALVFAASNLSLPIDSTGFCWGVQFTFNPSALALTDDIDGLWHYLINGAGNNEYWGFSNDELNLWQSNSIATDAGLAAVQPFFANADYALLIASVEPATQACLAPRGHNHAGAYYNQTEKVTNEFGVALNPNGGFDVGRGSAAISFSGTAGVPNPVTGVGNQNAANTPGTVTTLGFVTWHSGGNDYETMLRVTWVSIDILGLQGANPELEPGLTRFGGEIRLPVVSAGFPQPITSTCLGLFGHDTAPAPHGWPDPEGFHFFEPLLAGASWQVPTGAQPAACIGTAVNLTYGTTGRKGKVGTPGGITFDPSIADASGSRELYLFN